MTIVWFAYPQFAQIIVFDLLCVLPLARFPVPFGLRYVNVCQVRRVSELLEDVNMCVCRAIMVLAQKHVHISYSFQTCELNVLNVFLFIFFFMQVMLLNLVDRYDICFL
jgi:hypothetical protein